ncbi:DMT family transporter [Yoonia sp. 208BN28-4]|uniref:DMT family transporter n=1 Tax=Yoonia sp. 208BN28-4 TaxID=3126505 RepID=UPI0030AC3F05
MTQDRPFLGILLMLGFCVLAPLGDAMAKLLGETISIGFLVFVRFAVQAAILVPLVYLTGKSLRLPAGLLKFTLLRTCLHIAGISLMFSSLQYLPLADAVAIAFVMPFIMLLLGHYVLGEEVGAQRMWACAVGFVGTLLVIQPNFAAVGWPALMPLGVAVVFALFMLVTRRIAKEIDAIPLQAISGIQAIAIMAPAMLLFPELPFVAYVAPDQISWILLFALGALGTFAHLLMTWSLRFAPSATLAPMQYLEIPISTLIGWLIFYTLPNGLAAVGIVITMAAGLYIILREQRLSRQAVPPAAA